MTATLAVNGGTFSYVYKPTTAPTAGSTDNLNFAYTGGGNPTASAAVNWGSSTATSTVTLDPQAIQASAASSGAGSKFSTWSRPTTRRRTRPARSSMRTCLETELSEIAFMRSCRPTRSMKSDWWDGVMYALAAPLATASSEIEIRRRTRSTRGSS